VDVQRGIAAAQAADAQAPAGATNG